MRILYVADPMCSWCFGFAPSLAAVRASLPEGTGVQYVMGGLAADDDQPMTAEMKAYIQDAWRSVEARTGVTFNHAFWDRCTPRRSTWPACRAVLAAEAARPGAGVLVFEAIQQAYYVDARDPSDRETLIAIVREVGVDVDFDDEQARARLSDDLALRDRLQIRGFPSLALETESSTRTLIRGWCSPTDAVRVFAAAR